jgi:hypothetical protein
VREQFSRGAHVYDADIAEYVSRVLVDFADVEHLYRIRNAQGRLLEDVAEMLGESNPLLDASSFDREREVRKHVGDFTLFFSGFFSGTRGVAAKSPLALTRRRDRLCQGRERIVCGGGRIQSV